MGGVGSFNRQNRTLYVGRIKETGNGQETEEVVLRHFKEWGDIERGDSRLLSSFFTLMLTLINLCSPSTSISQRSFRDVCLRIPRSIRKRSHGLPIPR